MPDNASFGENRPACSGRLEAAVPASFGENRPPAGGGGEKIGTPSETAADFLEKRIEESA
jgi:hypothetical protein